MIQLILQKNSVFSRTFSILMRPTPEQEQIIECGSSFLKVNAFAGTGKTTTLVQYAGARPRTKMLYIAFNKAIQTEAQHKFGAGSNVKCVTSHGLAFPRFGSLYANANKLVDRIRVNQAVDALGLKEYPEDFKMYVADSVLKSIDRYLVSDSEEFDEDSIARYLVPGSEVDPSDIALLSKKLWAKMCDVGDPSVGMVHDGYLKLYSLSKPRLNYDSILFDEAQDANPVTADLVENQSCARVIVGDNHQSIYSFRGATNAMRKFDAELTLYLTKSFRFGQEIADVGNALLKNFKGERKQLIGTDAPSHIGGISRSANHLFIARANATIFDEAVQMVNAGRKIGFIGGISGYRMGEVLDSYNLWSGNKRDIKSPYLKTFKSFETMAEYSNAVDDKELKSLVRAVKNNGSKIPRLVKQISGGTVEESKNVDVWLSTPHKAKGLEHDNVRMADDFMDLMSDTGGIRKIEFKELEEVNIVYVVATRAKKALSPYPDLAKLLIHEKNVKKQERMPEWARPAGIAARAVPKR